MTTNYANPTDLTLNAEEQALLDQTCLDSDGLEEMSFQGTDDNAQRVVTLLRLLTERNAIPEHRLRTFTEADHYPGVGKRSLKAIFEGNGTRGDAIARHPHFLAVMAYFLNGPDLPAGAKQEFAQAVDRAGGEIGGEEVIEVGNAARGLVRRYRLTPHGASGEFFKLALEHGAHPMWAKHIYERVRSLRLKRRPSMPPLTE